jgi:hypothetical protein
MHIVKYRIELRRPGGSTKDLGATDGSVGTLTVVLEQAQQQYQAGESGQVHLIDQQTGESAACAVVADPATPC